MHRHALTLLCGIAAFALVQTAAAQQFKPKTIQFKGAPDFSDADLLAASGLKSGVALSQADMNAASQRLMDSGVFSNLSFKFDGQDLIFVLTPAAGLLPIQLANFPIDSGKELDAELHSQFPLYHGLVPTEGGLMELVRAALETKLASAGFKASVLAVPGLTRGKANVVSYSITSPAVVVGDIRQASDSAALDSGAQAILSKLTGAPYDADGTPSQISTYLGNYFHDNGYLEAAVKAGRRGAATMNAANDAIQIPFEVSAAPGKQYCLAAIKLSPDLLVAQADFDHQAQIHPGDVAAAQRLNDEWAYVARQYKNHGYMKVNVDAEPDFDRDKGTVTYTVSVQPGPQYTMGNLTIENVSDELRAMMLKAWKMPAGSIYNQGAIIGFFATHGVNPDLERVFANVSVKYTERLNDANRTVDLTLRLERKH